MTRDLWNAVHRCTKCNSVMKQKQFSIEGANVRGWECTKCHETALHPEDAQRTLLLNKLKRGLAVKIGRLGKSLVVRIPKEMAQLYKLSKGENVMVKAGTEKSIELQVSV